MTGSESAQLYQSPQIVSNLSEHGRFTGTIVSSVGSERADRTDRPGAGFKAFVHGSQYGSQRLCVIWVSRREITRLIFLARFRFILVPNTRGSIYSNNIRSRRSLIAHGFSLTRAGADVSSAAGTVGKATYVARSNSGGPGSSANYTGQGDSGLLEG